MKKIVKKLSSLAFALAIIVSIAGCSTGAEPSKALTAEEIAKQLQAAELPVGNIIVYTSENDLNKLLGRPNQYISKVNFVDTTVEQGSDPAYPVGGTIETFNNAEDLKSRKEYCEEVTKSVPSLTQYHYANGNYYLRIDGAVTPENAKKYEEAFSKIG